MLDWWLLCRCIWRSHSSLVQIQASGYGAVSSIVLMEFAMHNALHYAVALAMQRHVPLEVDSRTAGWRPHWQVAMVAASWRHACVSAQVM